ncbi:MAG TPA: hypothetical protein VMN39_07645, partial [Longimicrobiaceae bacterium]|nr:hypothetical protein [Longimicrobiaceae bacterium]
VPIAEAFAAIRSGLTGEQEPLKRFGIMLDAATVKTRALADRSREVTGELTQQELATARLAIITERAGVVIGDLDRTQNSAANTAARITATYRQLREDLATGLLPIFGMVVTAWGDVASGAHGAVNVLDGFFTRIGDFVEMVQRLAVNYNAMFRSLPALLKQFLASQLNDMVTEFLEPLEGIVNRLRGAFGKEAVDFTSGLAAFAGRLRDEAAADIAAWKALMDQEVQAIIDARTVIQEHRAAPGVGATEGKEGGGGAGLDIPNVARREMEVSVSGLGEAGVAIQDELVAIESGLESVNPFGRMIEEVDLTAAYMRDGFRGVGQAIVSQLIAGRAEEQFASGLAALASGIWPPNPAALFAAGKHFAAAAAFKVLGGALGGALGGGGGGSGGGGSVPPGAIATSAPSISQLPGTEVNIFLDQLSPADPRFQRVVLGTVQNARERFGDNVRVNVHPRSTG